MHFLVVLIPLFVLSLVYFFVAPVAVKHSESLGAAFMNRWPQQSYKLKNYKPSIEVLRFAAFILVFATVTTLIAIHEKHNFLVFVTIFNVTLAILGAYMLLNKWYALLIPMLIAELLVNGPHIYSSTLHIVFYDVLSFLALLGAYCIVSNVFTTRNLRFFIIGMVLLDIFMVASGTLFQIMPMSIVMGVNTSQFFNFLVLPFGFRIGAGDFLGLLLLTTLVIRTHSSYYKVFLIYGATMFLGLLLITNGVMEVFPATIPLIPALIMSEFTKSKHKEIPTLNKINNIQKAL